MKSTEKNIMTKPLVICVLALICCLLWGSATPCIKTGYNMLNIDSKDIGSQILFAGIRFAIAGIMVIVVTSVISRRFLMPKRQSISKVLKLSMVQTVIQYVFFYIGLANSMGVKSSIVQGANVFISLMVAGLIFKLEKITVQKISGCILGFAGIVLINVAGQSVELGGFSIKGEGFVLLSLVAYAFSSVMMKKYSAYEQPYTLSGYQFLTGGIILAVLGILLGGKIQGFTTASVILLLYMSFISATAYTIWGVLLKYNPVGKVTIYSCTIPIFGVILSAVLLKEAGLINPIIVIISLALICIGIYNVNKSHS